MASSSGSRTSSRSSSSLEKLLRTLSDPEDEEEDKGEEAEEEEGEESTREKCIAKKHSNKDDDVLRQAFYQRLSTFTPNNFFAKPPSISPIVCARFGWQVMRNNDNNNDGDGFVTDTLTCVQCQATWNVSFPTLLVRGRTAKRLTEIYQQQLSNQHSSNCRFGTEARLYYQELVFLRGTPPVSSSSHSSFCLESKTMIPLAMATLLPKTLRKLWEDTLPRERFQKEWKTVCQRLRLVSNQQPLANNNNNLRWSWSLPDNVHQFSLQQDDQQKQHSAEGGSNASVSLLTRIVAWIRPNDTMNATEDRCDTGINEDTNTMDDPSETSRAFDAAMEELAVALILFGWSHSFLKISMAETRTKNKENACQEEDGIFLLSSSCYCCRLKCPFCLSISELRLESQPQTAATPQHEPEREIQHAGAGRGIVGTSSSSTIKNNLSTAHRYYCPFVCGFPVVQLVDNGSSTTRSDGGSKEQGEDRGVMAIWKILALRLVLQQQEQQQHAARSSAGEPELGPLEAYEQVRKLLHSTVSTRVWKSNKISSSSNPSRKDDRDSSNFDNEPFLKRKRVCTS